MKDTASIFAVGVLGLFGFIAFLVVMALLNGWAIATLWGWFVVPIGVKAISFVQGYGIGLIASVLLSTRGLQTESNTKIMVTGIALPIVAVFFGWIAVQFV